MARDFKDLFWNDYTDKQMKIEFSGGVITNEEIHQGKFELSESICSENTLRFGCCEANKVKFTVSNVVVPLKDKKIHIYDVLNGIEENTYEFGYYKVNSDIPTADRKCREVIAYDAMYDINNAEVSAWYNRILPNENSTITMKEFRCSFLDYMGIEYEDVTLINDDMVIEKTIKPTTLSGNTVITAICEINGCFGNIGRDGKFQHIFLKEMVEGLYPSDTLYPRDDLYPSDPMNVENVSKSHYINATYEDFTTERISKLLIRKEENDIGASYPTGNTTDSDNCYIIQDNFLLYGKSTDELTKIAANTFSIISNVWYRPANIETKGNPCLIVGDGIKLSTRYEIIYTYILNRTLTGIQSLRDIYEADGEQYQSEKVNSTRESIIQLKGKTNKLTRTLEETILEMEDIEKGLTAEIKAVAGEVELSASDIKNNIISYINVVPGTITIKSDKIDLDGLVQAKELVSKFATISTLNATKAELNTLIAQRATIDSLNAATANLSNLIAQKATISDLNATNLTVSNLKTSKLDVSDFTADKINAMEIKVKAANITGKLSASQIDADFITAETVKANYMEVKNWTVDGLIKASKIDVEDLFSGSIIVKGSLGIASIASFSFKNITVDWMEKDGIKYLVGVE